MWVAIVDAREDEFVQGVEGVPISQAGHAMGVENGRLSQGATPAVLVGLHIKAKPGPTRQLHFRDEHEAHTRFDGFHPPPIEGIADVELLRMAPSPVAPHAADELVDNAP